MGTKCFVDERSNVMTFHVKKYREGDPVRFESGPFVLYESECDELAHSAAKDPVEADRWDEI